MVKINLKGYTSSKKGLTLIEILISVAFIGILLALISNIFTMNMRYWTNFNKELEVKRNINIAKVFIEKRTRECNQAEILYDDKSKRIKGKNGNGNTVIIDFSGKRIYDYNTLIYFYRDAKEIRVNKSGEHNVLSKYIEDIKVTEIVPGQLLEVVIFAELIDYSIKLNLRIK